MLRAICFFFSAFFIAPLASAAEVQADLMKVHLIDVGQGASTLIEFPCAAMLIDTGGETESAFDSVGALKSYLEKFFLRRADLHKTLALLAITHPHKDHALGAEMVFRDYEVKNVVDDGWNRSVHSSGYPQQHRLELAVQSKPSVHFEAVRAQDIPGNSSKTDAVIDPISCDQRDPEIEVLWGLVPPGSADWSETDFSNENNNSVVFKISYGQASALITGDLQERGIKALLTKYAGTDKLKAGIYEAGHHGSHNGTTVNFLRAISPKMAIIAVGPFDRETQRGAYAYAHPRKNIIDMMQAEISEKRMNSIPAMLGIASHKQMSPAGKEIFVGEFQRVQIDKAIYATAWDGNLVVEAKPDGTYAVRTAQ